LKKTLQRTLKDLIEGSNYKIEKFNNMDCLPAIKFSNENTLSSIVGYLDTHEKVITTWNDNAAEYFDNLITENELDCEVILD